MLIIFYFCMENKQNKQRNVELTTISIVPKDKDVGNKIWQLMVGVEVIA